MNIKLCFQATFLSLLVSLPALYLGYHLYTEWHSCQGAYIALSESLKTKTNITPLETKSHHREGIVKQIWFRPLENGAFLYLQAHSSKLVVESIEGHITAKERLYNVFAGFQDTPSLVSSNPEHPWLMRILRAKAADFDYTQQTLDAGKVDLEIYQLPKPYDLALLGPPMQTLSTVIGSAERIHLNCKSSPPTFKAKKFRAFINPQAPAGSS